MPGTSRCLLVLALAATSTPSFAWDSFGHMVVADVVPTGADVQATDDAWAAESLQMAESDAYAGIGDDTLGTHKLSGAYLAKARSDARLRVALAGARLSWVIQQNLR